MLLVAGLVLAAGCATNSKPVDMTEPRRVVGTENDVRVDAEVFGESMSASTPVSIKYDITNHRANTILVADIVPITSYDPETQTVTVNVGSEVPGASLLPRLIPIHPNETKNFVAAAHLNLLVAPSQTPFTRAPRLLRLKVNFLGETKAFEKLIAIPEKAVNDPKLADELFPKWVDDNETVVTNALPMHWTGYEADPTPNPRRSRRRP